MRISNEFLTKLFKSMCFQRILAIKKSNKIQGKILKICNENGAAA